jgi:hypothetical protein
MIDGWLRRVLVVRSMCILGAAAGAIFALAIALPGSQAYASEGEGAGGGEAPAIEAVGVAGVSEHEATLEAQIDPNGAEAGYEFWLSYAVCQSGRYRCESVSVEPRGVGTIGAGAGPTRVSTQLSDLSPGYVYSYWVIATSPAGSTTSARSMFKALAQPASIDSESVSQITANDATLEAEIDPNGAYTGYEFQVDVDGSYDFTQPVCPFSLPGIAECETIAVGEPLPAGLAEPPPGYLGAELGAESVSLDLASIGATLEPATTYHYRVLVANSGETVVGSDQTFTTAMGPSPASSGSSEAPATPQAPAVPVTDGQVGAAGDAQSSPLSIAVLASPPTHGPSLRKSAAASKLSAALKACEKLPKRRRSACRAHAETKHGTPARDTTERAHEPSRKRAH